MITADARRIWPAILGTLLVLGACGGGTAATPGAGSPAPDSEAAAGEPSSGEPEQPGAADASASAAVPAPPASALAQEQRAMGLEVTLKLTFNRRDAGIVARSWSFEEGRKYSIEKTAGNAVTELSVVYGRREGKGLEGWTPLPTENRGYRVRAGKGGNVEVLDSDGRPAGAKEHEVAKNEYGYLGQPHPLLVQVVAAKPSAGGKLSLDAAAAVALIGYMPEMSFVELAAVYQGTGDEGGRQAASLQVSFKSKLQGQDLVYALDLTGPAAVDAATGWVLKLELSGKVTVTGKYTHKGKVFEATGSGKSTFSRRASIK